MSSKTNTQYKLSQPLYYKFTVNVNKCGASCNTIDDLYPRVYVYVPDKVKDMNIKVFSLMSKINEKGFLVEHDRNNVNLEWMKGYVKMES